MNYSLLNIKGVYSIPRGEVLAHYFVINIAGLGIDTTQKLWLCVLNWSFSIEQTHHQSNTLETKRPINLTCY